jgi:hypothetical protein
MSDPNWFRRKWGFESDDIPTEELLKRIEVLEQKYESLLKDVVRLEEENIETNNVLYELSNSLDAVDARIDILTAENWLKDKDV